MKFPLKKIYCFLLCVLTALMLTLNIRVLNKLYLESNNSHDNVLLKAIRITENGTVKINLAGLLLPAYEPSNDFRKLPIINEHKYNFINQPKDICIDKTSIDLLVAVISSVINFDRRRLARRKEEKLSSGRVVYLFFLGKSPHLTGLQNRVDTEASKHGDIVQEDFEDSERNLSLKSVSILKWVNDYCPDVKYVIKKDDDIRLNITVALNSLLSKKEDYSHFVMGNSKFLVEGPIRDELSKYYTSVSEYKDTFFPIFVHGPAYGFPGKTAIMLYQISLRTKLFWLEDVYITGICAHRANIPVFFDKGFIYIHNSVDLI